MVQRQIRRQTGLLRLAIAAISLSVMAQFSPAANAQEVGPVKPIEVKPELADLGKRLFYDVRLSGDTTLSCSSCHLPEKAFTDGNALSDAYSGAKHFRNTPTLANVGHRAAWFHDGRVGTNLNDVTREMITETYMMNMDMRIMQERHEAGPGLCRDVRRRRSSSEPSNGGARNALIQNFMKTITVFAMPRSTPARCPPPPSAAQGLFEGKGNCVACHSGDRFTDDKPHNIGVPDNPEIWADPLRHIGLCHLRQVPWASRTT